MRILLLGEYSGVHTNLGKALRELGHEVMLVSDGDGYRDFPTDLKINTHRLSLASLYNDTSKPIKNYKKLIGFDAVQLIGPFIFNKKLPFYNELLIKHLKKDNGKLFLISAGSGYRYYESNRNLEYNPCIGCETIDKTNGCPYIKPYAKYSTKKIEEFSDKIIPLAYEYWMANKDDPKCSSIHNYPIDTNRPIINEVGKKLIFFHGITEGRYGFKGSSQIQIALEEAKKKYPNDIEVVIKGGLPYKDYIQLFNKVNVVVDQLYSYSLAMNALNAMCTGKIVLGGVEPIAYDHLNHKGVIPAFNITPSKNHIIKQVEAVLENRYRIEELAKASSDFVKKYFDNMVVAQHFLQTWNS